MKIKKIILYSLGILLLLLIIGGIAGIRYFNNIWFKERPDYLSLSTDFEPIHFKWSEGLYGDYLEPHDAIIIPIRIDGLPHRLYFQFDTGAPTTMIYGNSLQSLKKLGVSLNEIQKEERTYVEEFRFNLGGNLIDANRIKVYENYGQSFEMGDTLTEIKIGTIGADFLSNHITEIDFKNQIIQFYKEREEWMSGDNGFTSFNFEGRRLMLPCEIDNKSYELFYDSGSSAFGLITTKKRYDNYSTDNSKEVSYEANSWGDKLSIRHRPTSKMMKMSGLDLSLKRVSFVDMYTSFQGVITPFTRIGGWLGNKPFTDCSLIFDIPNEEFTVIKK